MQPLDQGWKWGTFKGSHLALKWNRRELASVAAVLPLVRGRTVAVQAGGNLGIFPKALAREFRTVYTFEPAWDLFRLLMLNAPEPNIVKFQAALGAEAGLVGLSRRRRDGKPHHHEGITHVAGSGTVPVLRLDDLRLPVVDLLYLDVEGYELFALQGARETIARCQPVIAVEINKCVEFVGHSAEEVRQWIEAQAYRQALTVKSDEVFVPRAA